MKVDIVEAPRDAWAQLSADAHLAVFGEILPPEFDRIDFAILAVAEGSPVAYATVRELDAESAYLKHGGSFPPIKGTMYSLPVYQQMLGYLAERYLRVTTLVENTNCVYLRMALKSGFKIIGLRKFRDIMLVELLLGKE